MQLSLLSFRDFFQYHHLVLLKGNFFGTLIFYIKQCSILCNVYTSLHIKRIIRGWLLVSKAVQGLYKVSLNCIASRLLLGKKGIHMLSMDNIFPIIFHVHLANTQVKKHICGLPVAGRKEYKSQRMEDLSHSKVPKVSRITRFSENS